MASKGKTETPTKKSRKAGRKKSAKKKSAKKKSTRKANAAICFTIMPFGGWFNDYYLTIYKPAIENAGMKPHRADDLYRPGTIINDIWAYTQQAKLILADLTGKNANVFYELGLAHALTKPAILVAESMDDVPFDLRSLRVIEYDKNDPDWGETLGEKITNAITEVQEAPLQAVLPAFLDVKEKKEKPALSERQKEMIELKQDLESLRAEIRTRPRYEPRIRLGPEEARERIRRLMRLGLPDSAIIRRVREFGVPVSFIERQVEQFRRSTEGLTEEEETESEAAPLKTELSRAVTLPLKPMKRSRRARSTSVSSGTSKAKARKK